MPVSLKSTLRRLVLRGPVHDRWAARRGRQLDEAYVSRLVGVQSDPLPPPVGLSFTTPGALRRILLIADCMWEETGLVPELAKIADTRLLNLRSVLAKRPPGQTEPDAVTQAVEDFASLLSGWDPDVILFYARPQLLSEEVFALLRRRWKCPLFGMSLDDKMQFLPYGILADGNDNYQRWACRFDLNLTNCLAATDWYRASGCPVLYCPPGVRQAPELTPPVSTEFRHDFSFLGTRKLDRVAVIQALERCGIAIQLFGAGWPSSQWVDNANTVFRASQINLGVGFATPSFSLTTIKGRDFECPGVGACYLTTYNWELAFHWELGKEILCYRSVEELVEMYSYYRKRPEECLKIAQAAWRRSVAEHTWEKRFRKIFQQTGFQA